MLIIGKKRKSNKAQYLLLFLCLIIAIYSILSVTPYEWELTEVKVIKKLSTEEIMRQVAEKRGFKDIDILIKIAKEESEMNQFAVGVNKDGSYDRGILQLNSYYQRKISNECAFDIACATNEAISIANSWGGFSAWYGYYKIK